MKKIFLLIPSILLTLGLQCGQGLDSYWQSRIIPVLEFGKYQSYVDKCPEVFINIELKDIIPVQSKPDGGVLIAKLRNNPKEGTYYNAFLLKKHNDMFLTAIFDASDVDRFIAYGWVDKKYLGIYLRNYSQPLFLFATPDYRSDKLFTVNDYFPEIVQIVDFNKLWIKVDFCVNKHSVYGWIPREMQCPNVWTTCS